MRRLEREVLGQFSRRTHERFPDAEIRAFGSRSREYADTDSAADSDFDLCVISEAAVDSAMWHAIQEIAWEIGFENDILLSVLCFSRDEIQHGPLSASPLIRTILTEGIAA